jgi:hypothetical protein
MNLLIHVSLIFSQLLDHRIASWFMPSQLVHSRRHRIVSNGLDVALQFVVATRSEYIQPFWILACYIPCELKESHTCLAKRKRGNPILSRAECHFSIVLWAPSTLIIELEHAFCLKRDCSMSCNNGCNWDFLVIYNVATTKTTFRPFNCLVICFSHELQVATEEIPQIVKVLRDSCYWWVATWVATEIRSHHLTEN